jgi:CheY-like chemotaxis protein
LTLRWVPDRDIRIVFESGLKSANGALVENKLLSDRRMLVVEDDMMIRLSLEDMLVDLGCNSVSTAATVDQSLRLIDAQVFDAATLDVNLNGTCSYPVAETLARRGVPFVFSTGYDFRSCRH